MTTALAGVAVIIVLRSERFFDPALPIEWIQLVALLIGLFALVCAWGHTLLALKFSEMPALDLRQMVEKLNTEDLASRDQHLADIYLNATTSLLDVVKVKQHNLALAYEELTMSAWFLGIVTVITLGIEILN